MIIVAQVKTLLETKKEGTISQSDQVLHVLFLIYLFIYELKS